MVQNRNQVINLLSGNRKVTFLYSYVAFVILWV